MGQNPDRHLEVQLNGSAATGSSAVYTAGGAGHNGHDPEKEELALRQFSEPLDGWPPLSKRRGIARNGRDPLEELALRQFSEQLSSWPPNFSGRSQKLERNKEVFRRWFDEAWNQGRLDVIDETTDLGYVGHGAGRHVAQAGPEGVKALIRAWRTGFPDGQVKIDSLTAEGDRVVAHLTWSGTHTGPFYDIAPTGRSAKVSAIRQVRFKNGKIGEGWGEVNVMSLLQQIGALESLPRLAAEKHKRIFRRFAEEAWNKGNMSVVPEIFASEYVAHAGSDVAHEVHGPDGHAAYITEFRRSFPDVHLTYDDMLAEGELIFVRMRWAGTHTGEPYMGLPPSGKRVTVSVTGINRFVGDKIVEAWGVVDMMGLLQQLGLAPPLPPDEANKAIVRRYIEEVWNAFDLGVIDAIFAPNYRIHTTGGTMTADHQMLKEEITASHRTFPDFHMAIQHLVADGDKVAAHWLVSGTHLGEFQLPGMPMPIPPSGNLVTFTETATFRIAEGRIVEGWYMADALSMLSQLGAIPGPPASAPAAPPPDAPPDPEANKEIARRLVEEFWNGRNWAVADELYAPDATSPSAPELPPGPGGVRMIAQPVFAAFPDFRMTIDDMVAEGDRVVMRFTEEGTHQGAFLGIPATGKRLRWDEIGSLRILNGKIVETWFETDRMNMLRQMGLIPRALDYEVEEHSSMSREDENKAVFYRWFGEAWNKGEYAVAHEVISPQMQVHGAGGQKVEMGPEGLIGLIEAWRNAFPDGQMSVDGVVAEGNIVTALLTWRGTHNGDFYGIPPTGKRVVCTSVGIDGMENGIINAGWGELDMAGMMQQLGALPMVGPGNTAQGRSAEWGSGSSAPRDTNPDPEANKALLLRFVEAVNKGDRDTALATINTQNYVEHNPVWGATDLESSLNVYRMLRAALPDMEFTIDPELTIAEGDMAVVHGTVTGTHTGEPLFGVPASGKKLDWTHSDVARIANGKIVERWISADTLRALQESGAVPSGA